MRTLDEIGTPCLVVERGRLARNIVRAMAVEQRRVRLRVHLKTVKSADLARLAVPDLNAPIAVSTLREAEYFFAAGYRDIFYAVGLGPGKVARAASLIRAGANLVTMVDSLEAATAVATAARREGATFRTVIEVDSGEHRGGVAIAGEALERIAQGLGNSLAGVATHAGQSYSARTAAELNAVAAQEARTAREAAAKLAAAGHRCDVVSIGSSPAALADADLSGVTEFRAGVYLFWDLFQAGIGACAPEDIALTVLAEVIGRPEGRNEFLIDAGAFALSKDISTAVFGPEANAGYGWVCDLDGRRIPGLKVARVWQEHGLVVSDHALEPAAFRVGSRVRILPNHACPTAAAHDRYEIVDGSRNIVATAERVNGW